MPTDFRAALERLISAYDEHGGRWPQHDEDALHDAVERARADLAAEPLDPAGGGEALLAAAPLEGEDNAWERAKERAWDMYKIVGYQGEQALDDRGFDRAADLIRDEITLARRVPAPADGEVVELAAPAAPPKGEVGELVADLEADAECVEVEHYDLCSMTADQMRRAATLLQRQAAELAALRAGVVPVAVSDRPWEREAGWLDLDGECWWCPPDGPPYWSMANPTMVYGGLVLPAHALPLPAPQGGEVEA